MKLTDPVVVYNAESNMDALMVQRYLEAEGVQAFAIEDNSLVGHWMFGNLPEIHKPQVWANRCDAERAGRLLAEYERRKIERDAKRKSSEPKTIEVRCEDCDRTSAFAGSLKGTVQECPHCGSYIDVGEFEWPCDTDIGDTNGQL
ncbi:MAG TPA: DUF2007 domain-containing protein [Thermoguttaceae bacterium]|nr:DUF2007 domain-containing protein [Thermoguttaceae bacterium]